MSMARPAGEYVEQMLDPGGWPQVDEDTFYDRAQQYGEVLRQVTDALRTCRQQHLEVFEGGVWSGGAADAADGELNAHIDQLMTLQSDLAAVITWHNHVAGLSAQAKSNITDNLEIAESEIRRLQNDPGLTAGERIAAINKLVGETHGANVSEVTDLAEQILATHDWESPNNALQHLLAQKSPPQSATAGPAEQLAPVTLAPVPAGQSPQSLPAAPAHTPIQQVTLGAPRLAGELLQPAEFPGGFGSVVPSAPGADRATPRDTAPSTTAGLPDEHATEQGAVQVTPQPPGPALTGNSPRITPAAAAGSAPMPEALAGEPLWYPDAGHGNQGAGAPLLGGPAQGGGAASGAASGRTASTTAPVTPANTAPVAAAAAHATTRPRSAMRPRSNIDSGSTDAPAPSPVIPVSAARAASDAISAGFTAAGKSDPLRLARRIAAALNAPGEGAEADFDFYWITAVSIDGKIVVANSYGLAYIPDDVQLPNDVHVASADDAIPAGERARWATYPMQAVQGWATHHNTQLRAVIGTNEQLAHADPGTAKIVLEADDIPDSGTMIGRPRLEVVDPAAAARLTQSSDLRLLDLLPPAAVAANPPDDQRDVLWSELMEPMASSAPGREAAHLQAFHTYAAHAKEIAHHQAHTAAEPQPQRAAVADWLYWRYVVGLLDDALTNVA